MNGHWLAPIAASFLCLVASGSLSAKEQGMTINMEELYKPGPGVPELIEFAKSFYRKEIPDPDEWAPYFPQHIFYALVNLKDRPGPAELILAFGAWSCNDGKTPLDEENRECRADIFRRTGHGYEAICKNYYLPLPYNQEFGDPDTDKLDMSDHIPDYASALLLPEVEHGYHRIGAVTSILHWRAHQKYNSGRLCWGEKLKP